MRISEKIKHAARNIKWARVGKGLLPAFVLCYCLHLLFYAGRYGEFRAKRLDGRAQTEHLFSCPYPMNWRTEFLPALSSGYISPPGCYCLDGRFLGPTKLFFLHLRQASPRVFKGLLEPLFDNASGWADRFGLFAAGTFWFMLLTLVPLFFYLLFPNVGTWILMFLNMAVFTLYPIIDAMMHI